MSQPAETEQQPLLAGHRHARYHDGDIDVPAPRRPGERQEAQQGTFSRNLGTLEAFGIGSLTSVSSTDADR
jgi:hypothetical protein